MGHAVWGYLLSGAALVFFTAAIVLTKAASNHISLGLGFLVATAVNVLFAGLALVLQLALSGAGLTWDMQAFGLFALAGVFATYLGRWFFYESVARFGPAKASVFQVSSPLFTALIAWLMLGENLSLWTAWGMLTAIAGLLLLAYKPGFFSRQEVSGDGLQQRFSSRVLQSVLLLGLCSSGAYAVGNVLRGAAVRSWPEPIAGALIGAVAGLALHLLLGNQWSGLLQRLRAAPRSGVWLYALVGVANISGQIGSIASMRYIPLSVAALVTLCTPLLVFPLSYWLFKNQEAFKATTLCGGALTLLGIGMVILR